jgi:hypothetical protein
VSLESEGLIGPKQLFSIPVLSALILVLTYFFIKQEILIFNKILYFYFILMGSLALKKYFYEYLQTTSGFEPYDASSFKIGPYQFTILELFCLAVGLYFGWIYF